jgi:hypothetical protein
MPSLSHPDKPPVYTCLSELLGWTIDRTASFPKSHRFTVGQRIDNLTLDAMEACITAIFRSKSTKAEPLHSLNLMLEKLCVLWRIACDRGWISQGQSLHAAGKIDEIGRMTGGWIASLSGPRARQE